MAVNFSWDDYNYGPNSKARGKVNALKVAEALLGAKQQRELQASTAARQTQDDDLKRALTLSGAAEKELDFRAGMPAPVEKRFGVQPDGTQMGPPEITPGEEPDVTIPGVPGVSSARTVKVGDRRAQLQQQREEENFLTLEDGTRVPKFAVSGMLGLQGKRESADAAADARDVARADRLSRETENRADRDRRDADSRSFRLLLAKLGLEGAREKDAGKTAEKAGEEAGKQAEAANELDQMGKLIGFDKATGQVAHPEWLGPGRNMRMKAAESGLATMVPLVGDSIQAGLEPDDPNETAFRSYSARSRDIFMHAVSGAAVTPSESARIVESIATSNLPPKIWAQRFAMAQQVAQANRAVAEGRVSAAQARRALAQQGLDRMFGFGGGAAAPAPAAAGPGGSGEIVIREIREKK